MIRVASNGKIDETLARPREGSVAISKTGDNPESPPALQAELKTAILPNNHKKVLA